jgi:hypothetical protein
MSWIESVKVFAMTNQLLEHDLDRIESEFAIDLQRDHQSAIESDETYYPQIESSFRAEAASMAPHYEIFYSLEKTIRSLIADQLEAASEDKDWWDSDLVPEEIRKVVAKRKLKETQAAVTPRSDSSIDFTTFGELSEIIKLNWTDVFASIFSDLKAVERVMAQLNTLRGPIAHCTPLAEDEVLRLQLSVRDWFRLME